MSVSPISFCFFWRTYFCLCTLYYFISYHAFPKCSLYFIVWHNWKSTRHVSGCCSFLWYDWVLRFGRSAKYIFHKAYWLQRLASLLSHVKEGRFTNHLVFSRFTFVAVYSLHHTLRGVFNFTGYERKKHKLVVVVSKTQYLVSDWAIAFDRLQSIVDFDINDSGIYVYSALNCLLLLLMFLLFKFSATKFSISLPLPLHSIYYYHVLKH